MLIIVLKDQFIILPIQRFTITIQWDRMVTFIYFLSRKENNLIFFYCFYVFVEDLDLYYCSARLPLSNLHDCQPVETRGLPRPLRPISDK